MITNLDDSVAEVFNALYKNNMLDNTIFVFVSDNGAPTNGIHRNHGSNWPLKGVRFYNDTYNTIKLYIYIINYDIL